MTRLAIRYYLSLALLGSVAYYCITRIPRSWKPIFLEYPVISHRHEVKEDWPLRLVSGLVLVVTWFLLFFFLRQFLAKRAPRISAVGWFFSNLGFGCLLAMAGSLSLGQALGPWFTKSLVLAPLVFSSAALFFFVPPEVRSKPYPWPKGKLFWLMITVAGVLTIRVLSQLWYSVYLKPVGAWDEATYWWPAVEFMNNQGAYEFYKSFSIRFYDPAYALILPVILFPVSGISWIAASSNFSGNFFGLASMALLLDCLVRGRKFWQGFFLFFVLYATVVLTHGGWVTVLQWRVGNGDGFAALLCTLLFLALWRSRKAPGNSIAWIYYCVGLGALAQLSKPPLTQLFVYLVPGFLLLSFFLARLQKQSLAGLPGTCASLWVGGILAKLVWAAVRGSFNFPSYYSLDLEKLMSPALTETNRLMLSLFHTTYRVQFAIFLCFGFLALIRRNQRNIFSQFLVACGLIFSIVWLYLTMWKDVEHESAGRYFTHGLLAWIWLYAIVNKNFLLAGYRWCQIKIHTFRKRNA